MSSGENEFLQNTCCRNRYCALISFYVDAEIHPKRKQPGKRNPGKRNKSDIEKGIAGLFRRERKDGVE